LGVSSGDATVIVFERNPRTVRRSMDAADPGGRVRQPSASAGFRAATTWWQRRSMPLTKPPDFHSNFMQHPADCYGNAEADAVLSVRECTKEEQACQALAAKEPNPAARRSLLRAATQWKFLGAEIDRFLNAVGSEVKSQVHPHA